MILHVRYLKHYDTEAWQLTVETTKVHGHARWLEPAVMPRSTRDTSQFAKSFIALPRERSL